MGLNEREIEWVQWNYLSALGSEPSKETTAWQGLVMAATDIKTWSLMGILYCVRIP